MSFRKDNKSGREERLKWESFLEANIELIRQVGLPMSAIESHQRFQYFLMHGTMYPYDDWLDFGVTELRRNEPEKHELLMLVLDKYFELGFDDPGMGGFSKAEKLRLARKYPRQFPIWKHELENEDNTFMNGIQNR